MLRSINFDTSCTTIGLLFIVNNVPESSIINFLLFSVVLLIFLFTLFDFIRIKFKELTELNCNINFIILFTKYVII